MIENTENLTEESIQAEDEISTSSSNTTDELISTENE